MPPAQSHKKIVSYSWKNNEIVQKNGMFWRGIEKNEVNHYNRNSL